MTNQETLAQLLSAGKVALQPAPLLQSVPPPLAPACTYDRVEGVLLGLAIGDALGNTTESQLPAERQQRHGTIRDYLPNDHAAGRPVGVPSDDTQLAFWTLEQLLADGDLVPDHLAQRFCRQQIFGVGSAVRAFLRAYRDEGRPWYAAVQPRPAERAAAEAMTAFVYSCPDSWLAQGGVR